MQKIIVMFFIVLLSVISCTKVSQTLQTNDKYRLVWNDDPATTMTVAWDQHRSANPVVYYDIKDYGQNWKHYSNSQTLTRTTTGYRGMNTHFAKLTDLQPDQAYYFIIKDDSSVSQRYWFKTAPDSAKPFTFIAGGDTKSSGAPLEAGRFSNRMVAKLRPLFVLYNGDFTSGDGTNDDYWKQWLNDWMTLTTTADNRLIPIIPVHGNHENGDKTVLNKLFDAPYQFDNEENIYYSLSIAGDLLHVIALNSEIERGGEQREWLEKDLVANSDASFTITAYHKPFRPHVAGKSEQDYQYDQWASLFHHYGVDLSLDADSHMSKVTFPIRPSDEPGNVAGFVRDDENGTMYIGEGSWGASPRPNNDDKPWTLRSGSFNQIKWLHVFPDSDDQPAHIDIRTVITATRNENDDAVSHVENVEALSEANVFAVPQGIDLFSTEPYGAVITYPFVEK